MASFTNRSIHYATLLVVLALVVGACGGEEDTGTGVASLQGGNGDGSSTTTARLDVEDAALDFSRCMRDGGIDIPDISFDAQGRIDLRPDDIGDIDVTSPEFQAAFTECAQVLRAAGAAEVELDPELLAILQDRFQDFSECMRENGITDFPDPDFTGVQPYPLSAFARFNDQVFQDALESCREVASFPGFGDDGG